MAEGAQADRPLDEDDQQEVTEALQFVQARWREIGTQLHLKSGTLNNFDMLNPAAATGRMVEAYLASNYNVKRFGPPTWGKIVEAVRSPAGGNNNAEAEKIAKNYAIKMKRSPYEPSKSVPPRTVPDKLPEPEVQPYMETNVNYFPYTEAKKVEMDGNDSKIKFERYTEWPKVDRLKEVKMSFGAVKPKEGKKKEEVAKVYDMSKWPHGLCVIINNEEFSRHTNREGTYLDECNLVQTFRHLGYIVEVHRDCKKSKMIEIFNDIQKRDHSDYDSFVCCIMSHGVAGYIFGSDSEKLTLEEISDKLTGGKCPTLRSKPKLFFLQACRGKGKDRAVQVDGDEEKAASVVTDSEARVASDGGETIPSAADFFYSHATPLNHVAYRDMDNGSWFVSELCKSLTSYGTYACLTDMVKRTNGEVGEKYSHQGYKQAPEFKGTVGKDVFFF